MKKYLRITSSILILLIITATPIFYIFGFVVPPNYIGVRVNYFSFGVLEQGYSHDGLNSGLHLRVPGISEIILLPRGFQYVSLNSEAQNSDLSLAPIEVRTANSSTVKTDVTLVLRLFEDVNQNEVSNAPLKSIDLEGLDYAPKERKHGGPKDLITFFKEDLILQLTKFSQIAQNEVLNKLNKLSTNDFYNPSLREQAALDSNEDINKIINPHGMELWTTLIRRYNYDDKEIDNQIFAKNIQIQTEKLRTAQTQLAEVTAQIDKKIESWNQKIKDKQVEGQNYFLQKQSEAKYVEDTKSSEGEKMYREKVAEINSKRNKLLAETQGAEIYVAHDMIPFLKSLSGGIVHNLDPYDIDAWVNKLSRTTKGGND
ncbi:MAG: hypothetical protein KBC84_02155 [Proteobacteria bacterium]|nr:hypothetical protein [Pseudomonadota bacterium]